MRLINLGFENENQTEPENAEEQNNDSPDASGSPETGSEDNKEPVDLNPNQTQDAIDAVNNQDSTEPAKVIKTANYKEELAALRAKNKDAEGGDDLGSDVPADEGDSSSDDSATGDGESGNENSTEETDVDIPPGTEEETEEEVAQEAYFKEGISKAMEAFEAASVVSQLYDVVQRESSLGGVSKHTARSCIETLEFYKGKVGLYKQSATPALEDFSGYSSGISATKQLKLSMEGFLEDVWNAIKKFFKALWEWITSIFTKKKSEDTKEKPMSKETQKESLDDIRKLKEALAKAKQDADKYRAKDDQKIKEAVERDISLSISKRIFKSDNKGTLAEIAMNCANVHMLIQTVREFIGLIITNSRKITGAILKNNIANSDLFFLGSGFMQGAVFSAKKEAVGKYLTSMASKEIIAGSGTKFIVTTRTGSLTDKNMVAELKELSRQGFSLFDDSKGNFPTKLPRLSDIDIKDIDRVIYNIESLYAEILLLNAQMETLTMAAKSLSESNAPKENSTDTEKTKANIMMAQSQFIGALTSNATSSVNTLHMITNSFVAGFKQYLGNFIA